MQQNNDNYTEHDDGNNDGDGSSNSEIDMERTKIIRSTRMIIIIIIIKHGNHINTNTND